MAVVLAATPCRMVAQDAADSRPSKPNIVFIISDDQDYEHLGFMGNDFVHTPTLDRLARDGTVFTTAHLPMSRCHPTLASFLSGRWPHQSGVYFNYGARELSTENSLPNLLKDAGYATYVEGKHWDGDPRAMGFTHGRGKTANTFVREGQRELFTFLDDVAGKQPVFVWWAPLIPHTPHNPPAKYQKLYDFKKMPVPEYVKQQSIGTDSGGRESWRKKEELSYAMEAWLDDGVTQLVEKLKAIDQLENTLFVFVIDNGWCNGLASKGSPFEKGLRTPIFFSMPGTIKGGQRFGGLVSTNDIYPTILDYAGVDVPESAAGVSLRGVMEGTGDASREVLFGAMYPAFATKGDERPERDIYALYARTQQWKYILYLQDVRKNRNGDYFRIQSIVADYPTRAAGDEDLYDLASDPYELTNLNAAPARTAAEHRAIMKDLKAKALAWWKDTGGKELNTKK
jgi:uncharacterized sulfatase